MTVRLFAAAREAVGCATVEVTVPHDGTRAEDLLAELAERYPKVRRTLRASRFVRNGEYLDDLSEQIRPGDEFAVHPPYGGG